MGYLIELLFLNVLDINYSFNSVLEPTPALYFYN